MAQIIVLSGGTSDERAVSLRSGKAVAEALRHKGYEVKVLDPTLGFEKILSQLRNADVIFPALHGLGGEDGRLQAELENHGLVYVGSDSQVCAMTFYKDRYHKLLVENKILTPETELVNYTQLQVSSLIKQPFVLKPNDGGSSIDTLIVREPANQRDESAIKTVFERHDTMILQALISGIEVTVAMLGSDVLPVIEIIPPSNQEFDYDNKYNGATQELCPPLHLSQAIQIKAQTLAKHVHRLTGCRDLSRTDIIIDKTDQLWVLEINTIPGLTAQSLLPKAAAAAGYDMPDLCDRLVQLALSRAQDTTSGN